MKPGIDRFDGPRVRFTDGTSLDVGVVIWATGYRSDYSWIDIPGVVGEGKVVHRRGVTDIPGLYFVGLSWQHTRGSALLGFVHQDAAYLAGRITSHARATQAAALPSAVNAGNVTARSIGAGATPASGWGPAFRRREASDDASHSRGG